jgi:hypothetical protein
MCKQYCSNCNRELDEFEISLEIDPCYDCRDIATENYSNEEDRDYVSNPLNWS